MNTSEEQFGFMKSRCYIHAETDAGDIQRGTARPTLRLHRPGGSICQGAERRTLLVHERQGVAREVHQTDEGHAPSVGNCGEVCSRNM